MLHGYIKAAIPVLAAACAAPRAGAASLWPGPEIPALGATGAALDMQARTQQIPPFQVAPRDEQAAGVTAAWAPADGAGVWLHYAGLRATWPDGTRAIGSGDVRIGADLRLPGGRRGTDDRSWLLPEVWLDWQVKLPNAADRDADTGALGLGTDETDSQVGFWLRWTPPPATILAGAGLLIMGDPLLLASQDDAVAIGLAAEVPVGPLVALGSLDGRLASPRNPADLSIGAGAAWPIGDRGWQLGAAAGAGLTPAAADREARAWLGWSAPDPETAR